MDDGDEEAMCRGIKVLWVGDGTFKFDGFEGVCTVEEADLFDNIRAFRSDPEVEGEEAGVQGATHVEETVEFDGVGGWSEMEGKVGEAIVDGDRHWRDDAMVL